MFIGAFTLAPVLLEAATWTGLGMTNDWTDAQNWEPIGVPGAGDIAEIPAGKSATINVPITVGSLILGGSITGNATLTIVASFSWTSGTVGAPVILDYGCSGLWSGNLGLARDLVNHGEVTCNANIGFTFGIITNDGIFHVPGTLTFTTVYSPSSFFNHGILDKPVLGGGVATFGIQLTNYADGDVTLQSGELYASLNFDNYGDVVISDGAILHTHTYQVYDGATHTGEGLLRITGNGAYTHNNNPLSIDVADTELDGLGIIGSGALEFTRHFNWKNGVLQCPLTYSGILDVNSGSNHGLNSVVNIQGTLHCENSISFGGGTLVNNGLILVSGGGQMTTYASPAIVDNHGIFRKPASDAGVFTLGLVFNNYADGDVIVENGELYFSLYVGNYGDMTAAAGAEIHTHTSEFYDGMTVTGGGLLRITGNGGYFYNTSPVVVDIADVVLNSIAIGGTGQVTVNHHFTWESGPIQCQLHMAAGSVFDVPAPPGFRGVSNTLTIDGVMNVNGGFSGGGTLNNNGTIHLNTGGTFGDQGHLNNAGLMIKHAVAGDITFVFITQNTGTIQCEGGNFYFNWGLANAGIIDVAAGAQLALSDYGLHSFDAGAQVTGAGTFTLGANLTVTADAEITIQNFVLETGYGIAGTNTLTFTNTVDWRAGQVENTMELAPGAVLNLSGGDPKYLLGTLINNGTVNCNGSLFLGFDAIINNNSAFVIADDVTIGAPYAYYASGQFNNTGSVDKSSPGTVYLNVLFSNQNGGALQVNNGILEVNQLDNGGDVVIASSAELVVKGGSNLPGGTVNGTGILNISDYGWTLSSTLVVNGFLLELNADLYGEIGTTLEIQGTTNWNGGNVSVPIHVATGGLLNLTPYGSKTLQATLTNDGTVQCNTIFTASGNIVNNGNFNITDNGGFFGYGNYIFNNTGQLSVSDSYYGSYVALFTINTGTINIEGPVYFYSGLQNDAVINTQSGSSLELSDVSVFNPGSSVTGPGSIGVGTELTLNTPFTFSGELFSLNGDLLGPNDLTIESSMNWSGGQIQTDVHIENNAHLEIGGGGGGGGGETFTLAAQTDTRTAALQSDEKSYGQILSAIITNDGTTDQFGSYDMDGGGFINNGQLNTYGGGIYDGGTGGTLSNNGEWNVNYYFDCYVNAINNGTFNGEGYYLTFEPDMVNNGTVSPGFSPGQMVFLHNYSNGAQLLMEVESDYGPGYGHDYIRAEENIQLSGALTVSESGAVPDGIYTIMECNGGPGCLTGTFASVSLPEGYVISYTDNAVVLTKGVVQPTASISPEETTICAGEAVTLTASEGDSYEWSTGETTQSIIVTPETTTSYSVTVTTVAGTATAQALVNVLPLPVATINPASTVICQGETTTLTASGGDYYQWSTWEYTSGIEVTPLETTEYFVTVTDYNGCFSTTSATVTVNTPTVYYEDADGDGYGNATAAITACEQPSGYVTNNTDCNDNAPSAYPGATEVCNGIDDDCDNTVDESSLSVSLSAGAINCSGGITTLVATATGEGTYTYSLDGMPFVSTNTFTVGGGLHTVEVSNGQGCTSSATITIAEPAPIVIDPIEVTHVACGGGNTGAIDITVSGGTGPYTYHWSNNKSTQDLLNIAPNTYAVTVTDAHGCTATATATVNPKLKLTTSKVNTTCNGGNDGSAEAVATGGTPPYSILWSTGATTSGITGLEHGTYSVTLTDALGCTRTANVNVGQPAAITISVQKGNVSCNGGTDGVINITVNHGVPPFLFAWSDGPTTEDRANLAAGTYDVTVTDQNGCTGTKSVTITEPNALTLSFATDDVTCNGNGDGVITATANGGIKYPTTSLCNGERYCYVWSNGVTSRLNDNLVPGTYSLTVTDINGCTITDAAVITEPEVLEITNIQQELLTNGKYRLTISAAGGTTPYKYKRIPGGAGYQASNVFTNVPVGAYQVIVRDKNLCEDTVSINVPEGAGLASQDMGSEEADFETYDTDQRTPSGDDPVVVYPNPAADEVNIALEQPIGAAVLRIFDTQGRMMVEQKLEEQTEMYRLSVSDWKAGIYYVEIRTSENRYVRKLSVARM